MKIVSKIALAASIGLALALALSCSDDDKSGGWLTCEEYYSTIEKCDNEIQCVLDAACNGTNKSSECKAHYEDQGCNDVPSNDSEDHVCGGTGCDDKD